MKKTIYMYDGDMVAEYDETAKLKTEVFNKLISWFEKNSFHSGESMQNDTFSIEAPEIMADILDDIIQFKTEWVNQSDDDLPW